MSKFCESCEWWGFLYKDGIKNFGECVNDIVQEKVRVTQDEASVDDQTILTEGLYGCIYHERKDQSVVAGIKIPVKH